MDFVMESLSVGGDGKLKIGESDVCALADKYGTPLYIMDEDAIRLNCRRYRDSMRKYYGDNFIVAFASKAFCVSDMYRILREEGMGADVVSGGELFTASRAGFPMDKVFFHGNNKTHDEIRMALDMGIFRFVIDNVEELELVNAIAGDAGKKAEVSFRIKPGIDAHTHEFIQTGQIDSKFGLALETGEAEKVISYALSLDNILVKGIHCHIGSQIFDTRPFAKAVEVMMQFMALLKKNYGLEINDLNLGGGFGIKYIRSHDPVSIENCVKLIADSVNGCAEKLGLKKPMLVLEPGRSIVAETGMTVYKVGSVKEIPGVRTYVSVDGGMTDNPRYALYGASYFFVLPERPEADPDTKIAIAGRCCESGDMLGKDIKLALPKSGEYLATLCTGAYNYSMASNYNRVPRLPVVMVTGGKDRLVVKRESYEDIVANDILY